MSDLNPWPTRGNTNWYDSLRLWILDRVAEVGGGESPVPYVVHTGLPTDGTTLVELDAATNHIVYITGENEATVNIALVGGEEVPVGTQRTIIFEPGEGYYSGFFVPANVNNAVANGVPSVMSLTRYERGWFNPGGLGNGMQHLPLTLVPVPEVTVIDDGVTDGVVIPAAAEGFAFVETYANLGVMEPGTYPKETFYRQEPEGENPGLWRMGLEYRDVTETQPAAKRVWFGSTYDDVIAYVWIDPTPSL